MIARYRRFHRTRPPITHVTTPCQWGRLGRLTSFAMTPGAGSSDTGYSQTYGYDANNNRTASTDQRTTAQGNLTHNALGQPLGWTWALNATAGGLGGTGGGTTPEGLTLAAQRSYNTAGELTATEFSQYTPDGRGLITALNQGLYSTDANGAWTLQSVPHTVQYDAAGRITSFASTGISSTFQRTQTFTFDVLGNGNEPTFPTTKVLSLHPCYRIAKTRY